jgi:alcohol dehydrogenase
MSVVAGHNQRLRVPMANSPVETTAAAEPAAWRLHGPGGALGLEDVVLPEVRPGTVRLRMEAVPILSYLGDYAAGKLPYWYPAGTFTPGTNGVGIVEAVGSDVYHFAVGQRAFVHPHLVAAENAAEPAQVLIGLTGISPDSGPMLAAWGDGTLSQQVLMPASVLAPLDGIGSLPAERLASLGKFGVPLGGLLRGRLSPGETLVVNGATGYFGSAAVLLGLALGAEQVIAAGRSAETLDRLRAAGGARVRTVILTGDAETDAKAIKNAAGGRGPHLAFDQVGRASDAASTLAALKSLQRGGRLVLMGSMTTPLPIAYGELMANDWEVIGNFMYRPGAFRTLVSLVRSGLLDLDKVDIRAFAMRDLPEAMDQAAKMRGLDCTVLCLWDERPPGD